MINPLDTLRKFQSRLGKPIRPIVEFQKQGSILHVITTSIETENMIQDQYRNEAWQLHPESKSTAVYVDGVFKGIGFYACEEGHTVNIDMNIEIFREDRDTNGKLNSDRLIPVIKAAYKGLNSKLLDASLLERASALKASLMEKLIFCGIGVLIGILMGMSYAK